MSQFFFTKMSGAGNDFIIFDKKSNPELNLNPQIITNICHRRFGIGADGVILIDDSNDYDFEMTYYNADGSTGSLCANGARCSLLYAKKTNRIGSNLARFKSNGIEYSGEIIDEEIVRFYLNSPEGLKTRFKIKAADQLITASFINTGSPHIVIKIADVLRDPKNPCSNTFSMDDFPVFELGKEIRYSKDFLPSGTNVNFIEISDDVIKIRSYERGVENETLACGTGSVAAAIISYINDKIQPPVKLIPKSGDLLVVDFKFDNNQIMDLSLTGPVKIIFNGDITI
ncbi:MAG: diaminopimelate epimerase [Melioribacter sp.]|nr:diaminopimelate epimerase [Melioribacter sp.]